MKKVTDLIHSAKKQTKYQIKDIFNLDFERDKHLMHTLYPPNVVKALEETILAAFLGIATARETPAQCSALILSGVSIPWELPWLWAALVFAAWVKSSTPYRVWVLSHLQNPFSEQPHQNHQHFHNQHCTCSTAATNIC